MSIFDKNFNFPKNYIGEAVTIFPTDIEFASSDYDAVMASKDELRLWSVSSWPEDDFTIESNREDLKNHVEDNQQHSAYGFMLYDSNKKNCYGSLYVNPINPEYFMNDKFDFEKFDARIDCWIRTDIQESLKIAIVNDVISWLRNDWSIRYGFSVRPSLPQYENIFKKCGLKLSLTLAYKENTKLYLYS
jgi:hypothetical protein